MGLKRTTVFAAQEDLDVIKAAAARRGVAEAELIRNAIHLAALAERSWSEPFFSGSYPRQLPTDGRGYADVVSDVRTGAVAAYMDTVTRS